jgi:hypothetical protein
MMDGRTYFIFDICRMEEPNLYLLDGRKSLLKGIVSRDFVVCFLVSFDRSDISTHQEWVLLLLKVRFRIEFFDFRVWPW